MEELFDLILTICAAVMIVSMTAVVALIAGSILWAAWRMLTS